MRPNWSAPQVGTWQLVMPSGYVQQIQMRPMPDGGFQLDMGRDSNLGGKYRWKSRKLVIDIPNDKRYAGLVWQWDGDDLVLVAEPPGTPAGPSYLVARLHFLSPMFSIAAPKMAAVPNPKLLGFVPTEWRNPDSGEWLLTMAAGFRHKVKIKNLPDGSFELIDGSSNLAGIYEVKNHQLEAIKPRNAAL